MLPRKRDADDGDEQDSSKNKMNDSSIKTSADQPDNIEQGGEASGAAI